MLGDWLVISLGLGLLYLSTSAALLAHLLLHVPAYCHPQVRKAIGPIATPDVIHWAPGLPKTRSGKIMRRGECNFYGL